MTYGSRGGGHPLLLGRKAVLYWHPTALLPRGVEGTASPGEVPAASLTSWVLGCKPTREVSDLTVLSFEDKFEATPRVTAAYGNHQFIPLARTHTAMFRVRHYPTTTANWQSVAGEAADLVKPFPRWIVESWAQRLPVAMAIMDSSADVSEGWLGNWWLDLVKLEPVRGIQQWDVRAVQFDYVTYRAINWVTGA
jgi:hypothetical protein